MSSLTLTVHNQTDMRAVSFSGYNALNCAVYNRIFIWGHRLQQEARPPMPPWRRACLSLSKWFRASEEKSFTFHKVIAMSSLIYFTPISALTTSNRN